MPNLDESGSKSAKEQQQEQEAKKKQRGKCKQTKKTAKKTSKQQKGKAKTTRKIKAKKGDALYKRGAFRKSARTKAEKAAPRNKKGEMICPTCGKKIPKTITQKTKNGTRKRRGYDLDHYPDTWSKRVGKMKKQDTPPARKEVLDEYNRDLRVQCPTCNQSHQYEGVAGTYK